MALTFVLTCCLIPQLAIGKQHLLFYDNKDEHWPTKVSAHQVATCKLGDSFDEAHNDIVYNSWSQEKIQNQ